MLFFVHVHKFTLSKLNKTPNSIVCTSKQDLELVTSFDSNSKFRTHPNNRIELEANSFPSRNWNLSPIQFHANFPCIQTQHMCFGGCVNKLNIETLSIGGPTERTKLKRHHVLTLSRCIFLLSLLYFRPPFVERGIVEEYKLHLFTTHKAPKHSWDAVSGRSTWITKPISSTGIFPGTVGYSSHSRQNESVGVCFKTVPTVSRQRCHQFSCFLSYKHSEIEGKVTNFCFIRN